MSAIDSIKISDNTYELQDSRLLDVNDELERQIGVERSRIDNIASLPSGSTSGDAELLDIRIGESGKNFSTAGNAVRSQIKTLELDVDGISERTVNLFDVNHADITNLYPNSASLKVSTSENVKSVIIPCEASTTYAISKASADTSGGRFRISDIDDYPALGGTINKCITRDDKRTGTITTGENASYLFIYIYNSTSSGQTLSEILQSLQVEKNTSATDYVPFRYGKDIPARNLIDNLNNRAVKYVAVFKNDDVIDIDTLKTNGTWNIGNVSTGTATNYPSSSNGKLIVFASKSGTSVYTVQIVVDFKCNVYVRTSSTEGTWKDWVQLNQVDKTINPKYTFTGSPGGVPYVYRGEVPRIFPSDEPRFRASTENRLSKLYGMYDTLMAQYPNYITRETIGYDCTGVNPIYCYTIKRYTTMQEPIFLITSNCHGDENQLGLSTFYTIKQIIEEYATNPVCKYIWSNVVIKVIPTTNPSGWDDCTRKNRDGININRDFPAYWDYISNDTTGRSMSQPETLAVMSFIESIKDKLIYVLCRHTQADMTSALTKYGSGGWAYGYAQSIILAVAKVLKGWNSRADVETSINQEWIYHPTGEMLDLHTVELWNTRTNAKNGTEACWTNSIGVLGSLVESDYGAGEAYSNNHYLDMVCEDINYNINYIANIIENYSIMSTTQIEYSNTEYTRFWTADATDTSHTRIELKYDGKGNYTPK